MRDKNNIHYFEIRDIITQFVAAFDDIVIGRFNSDKQLEKSVSVRYVYAPKQKVLHDLTNKAQHITVPVISVNITGIARDALRVQSKNVGHYIKDQGERNTYHVPQPVPVDISLSMSIITRYQDDMDQILANFIPYNDPYIVISWKLPSEFSPIEKEIRSQVLWDENISITQPIDMGEGGKYRNIAETNFTIKGWLFKRHPENPIGNIYEIHSNFYPVTKLSDSLLDLDVYDSHSLSAYPLITNQPENPWVVGTSPDYTISGDNFDYTTAVYLSSDSDTIFGSLSSYDNFDGIPLSSTEYEIVSDNILTIQIRNVGDVGNTKIIVENPAGYVVSETIESINI